MHNLKTDGPHRLGRKLFNWHGSEAKLNTQFYCINTSYPMDNCFTGRRDQSRQTPEKDVLYILPAGPVTEVAHRTSFLSRQCDFIASFSFGAWSVQTCFYRETFFEVLLRIHLLFCFYVFLLKYWSSCHPQDKREALVATLWLVLMVIWSAQGVGTRGLEKMLAWPRKTALFAKHLHQNKFKNWPPPFTEKGKVKIRRFLPPLPPFSWREGCSSAWNHPCWKEEVKQFQAF